MLFLQCSKYWRILTEINKQKKLSNILVISILIIVVMEQNVAKIPTSELWQFNLWRTIVKKRANELKHEVMV